MEGPYINNDAVVLGILMSIIAMIYYTTSLKNGFWPRFYKYIPPLLMCYILPALCFYPLGLISGESSKLYSMASRYLLPASLVYLCVSADLPGLARLGSKSLIMFFAGTVGIILGGIVSFSMVVFVFPDLISTPPGELWKGLSTICGSWIGGSANQTAMKEIYKVDDTLFGSMLVIDVIGAYTGMALLLYGAGITDKIDRWLRADTTDIDALKAQMAAFADKPRSATSTHQLIYLLAVGFVTVGFSHFLADLTVPILKEHETWLVDHRLGALVSDFFWMVLYATTIGLGLSFTRVREVEEYGASQWSTIFIYILVATIGMKMNISEVFRDPGMLLIAFIWLSVHLIVLFAVAYLIRAPFFYIAVSSQANIGGAASAPVVAAAFHPSLAPVGAVMAVLGYAVGTYGAILCAQWMASIV
jgi:uncharacterized membrane protein